MARFSRLSRVSQSVFTTVFTAFTVSFVSLFRTARVRSPAGGESLFRRQAGALPRPTPVHLALASALPPPHSMLKPRSQATSSPSMFVQHWTPGGRGKGASGRGFGIGRDGGQYVRGCLALMLCGFCLDIFFVSWRTQLTKQNPNKSEV